MGEYGSVADFTKCRSNKCRLRSGFVGKLDPRMLDSRASKALSTIY